MLSNLIISIPWKNIFIQIIQNNVQSLLSILNRMIMNIVIQKSIFISPINYQKMNLMSIIILDINFQKTSLGMKTLNLLRLWGVFVINIIDPMYILPFQRRIKTLHFKSHFFANFRTKSPPLNIIQLNHLQIQT